jgi:hypothetical protein
MALNLSFMGSKIEKRVAGLKKELFIRQGPGMTDPEPRQCMVICVAQALVLQRVTIGSLPDDVLL